MPRLRTIRRIYAVFFVSLFFVLIFLSSFKNLKGYDTDLFLELDPLTALTTLLSSGVLFKGLALSLLIIVPTLFFGRFFCSWICPLGIMNQGLSRFFTGLRLSQKQNINQYRTIYRLKYYILTIMVILSGFGILQTGLFDPIALITRSVVVSLFPALGQSHIPISDKAIFFQGGVFIALLFLAVMLANRFMTRYWCRVLCPLGALLGLMALRAPFRIRRDVEKCTDCGRCLRDCQGGCDPDGALRISECHVCMNCVEACPDGALHYGVSKPDSALQQPLDINRRRVLEISVSAGIFAPMAHSSITHVSHPDSRVIRPPGSLPEADFLGHCIKCAACMKVCPTNVLQPALFESGLEGLWTPILVNRVGYCEHHCVLCGQVCPTGAIRPITIDEKVGKPPKQAPIKLGTAFFDRGRCLPWAMDVPCIVCEEVCPTTPKAIWYHKVEKVGRDGRLIVLKQPVVEPSRCIGCGICENKCPVQDKAAIRVTSVGESRSKQNKMIL
ncbi:MAG: 4Fe-4S binding protein [Magnetococcales bacterium]|nr:4Fe-4S binding protein [Magnetococcales bacterium]